MAGGFDPFESGAFPICPATHDVGITRLFDLATILSLLECRPGDRVLDLGAGPGFASEMMARLGYQVVALDPDHRSLQHNRHRHTLDRSRIFGRTHGVAAVAETLPFTDAAFDGVLGMNVLHHVPELRPVVHELARVLKPGGRAVFCEPGLDHLNNPETKRALAEQGESDKPFDVLAFLHMARSRGFGQAMVAATVEPALTLVPVQEIEVYAEGRHSKRHLTPYGVVEELRQRHAFALVVRDGRKPFTSRNPSILRYRLTVGETIATVAPGDILRVALTVTNTGDTVWLAGPLERGGYVTVGCRLLASSGRLITDALGRSFLSGDVGPGESAEVAMHVPVPHDLPPGADDLQFDLVNELMYWFADLGNEPVRRSISVG